MLPDADKPPQCCRQGSFVACHQLRKMKVQVASAALCCTQDEWPPKASDVDKPKEVFSV